MTATWETLREQRTAFSYSTGPYTPASTLGEHVAELKRQGLVHLLDREHFAEDVSEQAGQFLNRVNAGQAPSIGQTLAAWYVARTAEIDAAWLDDEDMSNRTYKARLAAAKRLVVRKA